MMTTSINILEAAKSELSYSEPVVEWKDEPGRSSFELGWFDAYVYHDTDVVSEWKVDLVSTLSGVDVAWFKSLREAKEYAEVSLKIAYLDKLLQEVLRLERFEIPNKRNELLERHLELLTF
jgi:hypothetical protein